MAAVVVVVTTVMLAMDVEASLGVGLKAGWEVEDDVSSADWPKVCQACSTGCRACDDPSPAGCTACYPMYVLGSGGT